MKDNPLVSFCILTYNQEDFILDALKGAISQDYENMEIIISDDGSKDNTVPLIKQFVEEYKGNHKIIVNVNEKNIGIAQNFNKVFYDLSKGDILILADGDDVSLPNRTSMTVDYFNRFPEITSLSFLTLAVDKNLKPRAQYDTLSLKPHTFSIFTLNDIIRYKIGCLSGDSRALRRSVIEAFPKLDYAKTEDYFMYMRSLMIGSICYIREPILLRRLHDNNVSSTIPTRSRNKTNFLQFKQDIEWALSKGYITPKAGKQLLERMKEVTSYSIVKTTKIRLFNWLRHNKLARKIYEHK